MRAAKSVSRYGMTAWMFHRMNRGLLVMLFLSVAASGNLLAADTRAKHHVLYAPRPEYPLAARKRHWTGAGVFGCSIRSDGTVASVDVLRSTGHPMLDQAAISAFRQWRFQSGDMKAVKIPMGFWMDGSAARRRMSGAVIS
jgi:TonB family protein